MVVPLKGSFLDPWVIERGTADLEACQICTALHGRKRHPCEEDYAGFHGDLEDSHHNTPETGTRVPFVVGSMAAHTPNVW